MRIRLVCVGKPSDPELGAVHERFAARIRRFGVQYEASWVEEVRAGGRYTDDHVRERESKAVLAALDERTTPVAVDPSGDSWTSDDLARRLERWGPSVAFLVGGPLGHAPLLRTAARDTWALSLLTFPHELVRVLVAEQIYRALTIQRRVPYHK